MVFLNSVICCKISAVKKFLLFARKQEICGFHTEKPYFSLIPAMTVPNVHNPISLEYISTSEKNLTRNIYWTDDGATGGQTGLHTANLAGTDFDILDTGLYRL